MENQIKFIEMIQMIINIIIMYLEKLIKYMMISSHKKDMNK